MGLLLDISNGIRKLLQSVAFASAWLLIVLMFITCIDVIGRKLGIPIPLTKFQELEWYMHTALFSMWMGYNYTINAHLQPAIPLLFLGLFGALISSYRRNWMSLYQLAWAAVAYTLFSFYSPVFYHHQL